MSLPSVYGTTYGPAALDALAGAVTEVKAGDPMAPVTVIVPNNFIGIASRRALASGDHGRVGGSHTGLIAVDFLTTYRLAELLGAAALGAQGRRPVSTPIVAAAVRRALAIDPGILAPVADHPTTERRLVAAHRELSDLNNEELDRLASQSDRARDVVGVHRRVKELLRTSWYAEQDLLRAAIAVVEAGTATRLLHPTVLHLPQELSPARAALLLAVAGRVPMTILAGVTGLADADATVRRSLNRLDLSLPMEPAGARSQSSKEAMAADPTASIVPTPTDPGPPDVVSPAVRFTNVSDADDEVRHVVRSIVEAAREGIAFDRMAVVYATDHPYLRLLHDQLQAAGVPFNGAAVATMAESATGRALRRLLALTDRDYRRDDVTALLAGAPIRWRGTLVPNRAWEQISRDAGVVKGRDDWERGLDTRIRDLTEEIDQLSGDPENEWRTRRLERQVELTRAFAEFLTELIGELQRGSALEGWRRRARWCGLLLRRYLGTQQGWPEQERLAGERISAILDRLGGLDTVEPAPSMAVFRRSLDLELDGGLGRTGSFGNGVLIGSSWMSVGLALDRIWIIGLNEGTFPSRPRDDSLLPDRERRHIDSLTLRADSTGDEHRQFLAALASVGTAGRAEILRPRGDLRQADERAPSRWLVDLVEAHTGVRPPGAEIDGLDLDWIRHVPSFAAAIAGAPFPATEQEYELGSLLEASGQENLDAHPLVTGGPLRFGVELQRARGSRAFTRFDGNLAAVSTPDLTEGSRATSATRLETWARCPHQYFMRYLLKVDPLESPEQRLRIDALSRGTLVHRVLERFVQEHLDSHDRGSGWPGTGRARLHEIADDEFARTQRRGLTGEPLYWRRDQTLIRRDLDAFLDHDSERRTDQRLQPVATELGFGLGSVPPVEVELPAGGRLLLRGSIDLVDETTDGDLVVIDYKTGAPTTITEAAPHLGGTKLQLGLYAVAARHMLDRPGSAVGSYYWHIRARHGFKLIGYTVSQAIEAEVLSAVSQIALGIRRGVFPQHPEESTRQGWVSCHYCDPDGLGTGEARRRLLRKVADPELEDYLVLAAPQLVPAARLPSLGGAA